MFLSTKKRTFLSFLALVWGPRHISFSGYGSRAKMYVFGSSFRFRMFFFGSAFKAKSISFTGSGLRVRYLAIGWFFCSKIGWFHVSIGQESIGSVFRAKLSFFFFFFPLVLFSFLSLI